MATVNAYLVPIPARARSMSSTARFEALCAAPLDNPLMFGYCYTQLTDVLQEQNSIYRFDRRPKFDPARLAAIQGRTTAIERTQSTHLC